jgi:hypothetical protein
MNARKNNERILLQVVVIEIGTRQCSSMGVDQRGKLDMSPPPWILK